jgi:glucokinase
VIEPRWIVVITGRPATGKTALAARLHARCGWPLLAKDDIKEALLDTLGAGDRAWSRRLSDASFELLFRLAAGGARAQVSLLEGNFRMPEHAERLHVLARTSAARLLVVELTAEDAVISQRLRRRANDSTRHPGHRDDELAAEMASERQSGSADLRGARGGDEGEDGSRLVFATDELDDARLDHITSVIVASLVPQA